jgi:hypothetical protein
METKDHEARLARYDEVWDGKKLIALLGVSLAISLAVIYTIASIRSGDFSWDPTAHDPSIEVAPSNW